MFMQGVHSKENMRSKQRDSNFGWLDSSVEYLDGVRLLEIRFDSKLTGLRHDPDRDRPNFP